ncbi:MAG: hypothetical protein CBE10_00650 [bacterium TMED250]|jgi:AraC family chitin signaling transcriptional activator|nr:MAG: hypothetical protein CBE10_00650 [bacterium TMED250]|tara:strand:- start:410 stop:691 length:282 start_codon:yes stop_codon:yes gene_type:complete
MNSASTEKNWISFFSRFERENGGFVGDLSKKHPELTHTQFKVCVYLRSGYNTKSTASELGLSVRSVESHCYRIRKKFDLNHTINLATYLYSIS